MDITETLTVLQYFQRATFFGASSYGTKDGKRHVYIRKTEFLFAIPEIAICTGIIYFSIHSLRVNNNLVNILYNLELCMEAFLPVIYYINNYFVEITLVRVMNKLLEFKHVFAAQNNHAKIRRMVSCSVLMCTIINGVEIAQWFFDTGSNEIISIVMLETINVIINVILIRWLIYMHILSTFSACLLQDFKHVANDNLLYGLQKLRRLYNALNALITQVTSAFSLFLFTFILWEYMRLLFSVFELMYDLKNSVFKFGTCYSVFLNLVQMIVVVYPAIRLQESVRQLGRKVSRICCVGKSLYASGSVMQLSCQLLEQSVVISPYSAFALDGELFIAIFSSVAIYLILLLQIANY